MREDDWILHTVMREGDWVLHYPNDMDTDVFHQVKIISDPSKPDVRIRRANGREYDVPGYQLSAWFLTL